MAQQLKTFADIQAAVREELKVSATDSSTVARIKRDINIVYSEVINSNRWWWLQQNVSLQVPQMYQTGTCTVYHNQNKVTFSQPIGGKKQGYFISITGDKEIYEIESHSPGDAFVKITKRYIGASVQNVSFKIWTDRIPLPTNCKETIEVTTTLGRAPLENLGRQEYLRLQSMLPLRQGVPEVYTTGDFNEPFPTTAISALPNLITRTSSGIIKTLLFDDALPNTLTVGQKIKVSKANQAGFNGEVMIAAISQTNVARDTLVYTGTEDFTEVATPDADLTIAAIATTTNSARYRALFVYPAITDTRVGLQVEYQKAAPAMDADDDEPIIPIDDRIVLLYGALHRAWSRERNPEEAVRNVTLYKEKLARMAGQIQDSLDKPLLRPSKLYLGAKRASLRHRRFNFAMDGFLGAIQANTSGGSPVAVLGTPDTVAIFNSDGELEGSSVVSTTELNYLDGASSNIQAQIDAISGGLGSLSIVDSQVNAAAAIQRSKLANGSANKVVVNNGSGVMTDSSVTDTELTFLSGVIPLTSLSIPNNQAAPAPLFTIPVANTYCFILYSILRQGINVEGGTMLLLNDGTSADLTIDSAVLGATGIALSADVSGGNVRVLATSTNTGFTAAFKYAVIKWAA